nr:cupin domain-containing protein [uncultured Litoreibacter sp.]
MLTSRPSTFRCAHLESAAVRFANEWCSRVFEDIVAPGVEPGRLIHHDQDETFIFLEGTFDVEIDGVLYQMEPGDIGFVPRETVHAFKNVGSTPGRLRYVFSLAL